MTGKMSFDILTEQKFAQVYQALWKKLYGVGYNHLRDKALTQELVQDVFVKLWLNRNDVKNVEDAEAYLTKALRNKIYDHFDSIACRRKHTKNALENFSEERHVVDEAMVFNEGLSLVGDELRKMPKTTQTVFKLSRFSKYTNDEIAAKTRLSGKAVEYHITQAVKKLRVRLAIFLS
ncbi:MAG TPA: sigma-70 family RNA polymerase sigma factor [Chryseosolibacter sp.]